MKTVHRGCGCPSSVWPDRQPLQDTYPAGILGPPHHLQTILRHTFASEQWEAGESIVSVATWLGCSSPKVTLDYYAHFMPGVGKRGLAAMDTWLV